MSSPPPMITASTAPISASRPSTQRTARPPAIQTLNAISGKIRQPERRDVVTPISGLLMSGLGPCQPGILQNLTTAPRPALPRDRDDAVVLFPRAAQLLQKRGILRHPFDHQPALPFIHQRPARIVDQAIGQAKMKRRTCRNLA